VRPRRELHAEIFPSQQPLAEHVRRHRDEVPEHVVLEIGQLPLREPMLDVKPVVVTVLREAPVAQESPNRTSCCCGESSNDDRELPSALPFVISLTLMSGYDDSGFHRYSWFCQQPCG